MELGHWMVLSSLLWMSFVTVNPFIKLVTYTWIFNHRIEKHDNRRTAHDIAMSLTKIGPRPNEGK